jgi:hypothetical protein
LAVQITRRQDVQERDLPDSRWVIKAHPVQNARASVVPNRGKAVETKFQHHDDLVIGHRAK